MLKSARHGDYKDKWHFLCPDVHKSLIWIPLALSFLDTEARFEASSYKVENWSKGWWTHRWT